MWFNRESEKIINSDISHHFAIQISKFNTIIFASYKQKQKIIESLEIESYETIW